MRLFATVFMALAFSVLCPAQEVEYVRVYADGIRIKRDGEILEASQVDKFRPGDRIFLLSSNYKLQVEVRNPDGNSEFVDLGGMSFSGVEFSTLLDSAKKKADRDRDSGIALIMKKLFGYSKSDPANTIGLKGELDDTDVVLQIRQFIQEAEPRLTVRHDSLEIRWVGDQEIALDNHLGRDVYADILCFSGENAVFSALSSARSFINDSLIPDGSEVSFMVHPYSLKYSMLVVVSDYPIPYNMLDFSRDPEEYHLNIPLIIRPINHPNSH